MIKKYLKYFFSFFIFINIISFNIQALSESKKSNFSSEQIAFENWKKDFKKQAVKSGISEKFISSQLSRLKYLPNVLESDQKQSEFLLTFWKYYDKVITDKRVRQGKKMARTYPALLKQVSEKYGIPPKYILAFWGMETNYGAYKGEIDTLSALATLSYDTRRRAFFTNELITLLKLIEKGEKTHFKGSWAGAFGHFQFMPTTYAAYAVDATKDGKKDIINSIPDAFESAANYLSKMGWKKNQLWGKEVQLTQKINWNNIPENDKMTVREWQKAGVMPACGEKWSAAELDETARLVLPDGVEGPAFLTFKNYDYIMRWNNSTLYALSVGILADKIDQDSAALCSPRHDVDISRSDIRLIQEKLTDKGFYHSSVDGILGKNTKKAIRDYQKSHQLDVDGFPSIQLIKSLKEKE